MNFEKNLKLPQDTNISLKKSKSTKQSFKTSPLASLKSTKLVSPRKSLNQYSPKLNDQIT